jgi:Ca-activated chloride channel family protein
VTFHNPGAFWALLLVPALVAGYVWLVRRRAVDEAALGTMGERVTRAGRPMGWRRHVVPAVVLVAVVVLLVALARPEAEVDLPRRQGTVILAFDVSSSMKAKDLSPTRMAAAQRAARSFVADQPSTIRIGVVAFSDSANVVQPPTRSRRDVLDAINRLSPSGGTALARGILTSLNAIAGRTITLDESALERGERQPDVHFLGSAAIVLLSDGDNNAPLDPEALASVASQAGVRIFPVGIGSSDGAVVDVDGFSVATALHADLLRGIARGSGGSYFAATDAASLQHIYDHVDLKLTTVGRTTEITAIFAGAALALLLIGAGLSMRWYGRVI